MGFTISDLRFTNQSLPLEEQTFSSGELRMTNVRATEQHLDLILGER
jgi:hypothetical protein